MIKSIKDTNVAKWKVAMETAFQLLETVFFNLLMFITSVPNILVYRIPTIIFVTDFFLQIAKFVYTAIFQSIRNKSIEGLSYIQ